MLVVSEIYRSVLGESVQTGRLCSVVRLVGCHRRCGYCDSAYAFAGGRSMSVEQVLSDIDALGASCVLLTGGEPLLQDEGLVLMRHLVDLGLDVVLETSGTKGPARSGRCPRACAGRGHQDPGSGIAPINRLGRLEFLNAGDELKFVCTDRDDYEWCRDLIRAGDRLPEATTKTLSPAHDRLAPGDLADWIVADALDVRFQVQLHRLTWPDRERGV